VCAVNNEATLEHAGGKHRALGQPTEAALKVLAEKLGLADVAATQRARDTRRAHPGACESVCNLFVARCMRLHVRPYGC
jgi:Ca2+-transporting ATPase